MLWVTTIRALRKFDWLLTKESMDTRRALTNWTTTNSYNNKKLTHQKDHFRTFHLKQRKILYNGVVSGERKIC